MVSPSGNQKSQIPNPKAQTPILIDLPPESSPNLLRVDATNRLGFGVWDLGFGTYTLLIHHVISVDVGLCAVWIDITAVGFVVVPDSLDGFVIAAVVFAGTALVLPLLIAIVG